jgi:mono/diheme cytochrome c family protein
MKRRQNTLRTGTIDRPFGRFAPLMAALMMTCACPAMASDPATGPDPVRGEVLAQRLCATCHVVGEDATGRTVQPGVPSFPAIANKPDQTGNAISLKLIAPHAPMPDTQLTRAEILHLLAYLETLRTVDGERFLPPGAKQPKRPPKPSERPG